MFNSLCIIFITTLCSQHVASRHIVQQPYYAPYSDYSYTYAGPAPFHKPFQQHHSSFFSPPGTYYDQRQGILRPFPGGGVPVLVDYQKRCSNQFVGLKAHPNHQQYYYVCKPDSVIFGKCQNLQIFNATSGQCTQHPPPDYIPTCTGVGRFPLFSDCRLYYKCEEDLQPKIFSCPAFMVFSPISKKCTNGAKCNPTKISPHSSFKPDIFANKFPPCFENGIFRSPSDCSLYYKCDLKKDGFYLQTRLKCPQGNFYDLQKNKCLPANMVPCDCIQVAELVYPRQETVYPAQFDLESMVEGQYPVEQTKDSLIEMSNNDECDNFSKSQTTVSTSMNPTNTNNELMVENDEETAVLSDYIDIGEVNDNLHSTEIEELKPIPNEMINSSEERTSAEDSDFKADSEEITTHPDPNELASPLDGVTVEKTEDIGLFRTTIRGMRDTTDKPHNLIENEVLTNNIEEVATVTASSVSEAEEEATTTRVSARSIIPDACENHIDSDGGGNSDTQTKDPSQKSHNKCLTQHTTTSLNTDSESMKTKITPKIQIDQNSTTFITRITTTQLTTTETTPNSDNLATAQSAHESPIVPENENLQAKLLTSAETLDSMDTSQALENLKTEIEQTTQHTQTDVQDPQTTAEDMRTLHTRLVRTNSLEDDVSYEDYLESEITKKPKDELLEPVLSANGEIEPELVDSADEPEQTNTEANLQNSITEIITEDSSPKTLENIKLQEVEQTIDAETTTVKSVQRTVKSDSTTPNEEFLPKHTTDESAHVSLDNGSAAPDPEIKIEDVQTATTTDENFDSIDKTQQENISNNEKSVTLGQIEFDVEDLIPVHSKSTDTNELSDSADSAGFDDDFTTIPADEGIITTTWASTIDNEIVSQEQQRKESALLQKVTSLRRRQTGLDETVLTTKQITPATETLENTTIQPTNNSDQNSIIEESDELGPLDSEVVTRGQIEEEVSNNEITSAETIQTTSNSMQQQQFPHTSSTILTPSTQTSPTKPTEPSEKLTNNFILNIRKEDSEQPPLDSPPKKSLYYILKTEPVINNVDNKSNNETVTATEDAEEDTGSGDIPRLEIVVQRPIDIYFSLCPSPCDKDHKAAESTSSKRAVLLKWFARKSNQTLHFETGNEVNIKDH